MRTARRRIFTAKRLLVVAVLAAGLLLGLWFARRAIARWGVHRVLAATGLQPATFRVRSVGFGTLRVTDLSVGTTPWLTVGSVDVSGTLGQLLAGRVGLIGVRQARWTVTVDAGTVDWGYRPLPPPSRGSPRQQPAAAVAQFVPILPFDGLDLAESTLRIVLDGAAQDVPVAAHLAPAAPGTVTARIELLAPVNWESPGVTARLRSAAARVTIGSEGTRPSILDGTLSLGGLSLRAGDVAVSDTQLDALVRSPDLAEVTSLRAVIGDGTTVTAAPFTVNLRAPRARTRITLENLSLADWLPLITRDRATGEGRVSGSADVEIDWTGPTPRVTGLTGSFRADPSHGYIQVADADALGSLLERQDPRFATDDAMRAVRDKIVAALQDFAYHTLTLDLSRRADETIALTRLSGFGRHGDDPQGINLTLDLHVDDAFLDLGSRLALQSKIRDAAKDALDRFFQEGPTPRR